MEFINLAGIAREQGDYNKSAELYFMNGNFHEAQQCYETLLKNQLEAPGEEHQALGHTYKRLAEISLATGCADLALEKCQRLLDFQVNGNDHL